MHSDGVLSLDTQLTSDLRNLSCLLATLSAQTLYCGWQWSMELRKTGKTDNKNALHHPVIRRRLGLDTLKVVDQSRNLETSLFGVENIYK